MKITDNSALTIGRLMGRIKATNEEAVAVGLTLGTEENTQEFFAWYKSLTEAPTPRACFEKALDLREANGSWPEETDEEETQE